MGICQITEASSLFSLLLLHYLKPRTLVSICSSKLMIMKVAIFALLAVVLVCAEGKKGLKVTHKAWFEIAIDGESIGKIEIGLKLSLKQWRISCSSPTILRERGTR